MSKLEAKNITIQFDDKLILKNVSFAVEKGSMVGLVGANGSGKSSLLRAVIGILESPTGEVLIDGQSTNEMTLRQRARQIA